MKKTFNDLVRLTQHLRGPGGCPWDREQTHESVKSCLVEETYEVLEAIDEKNPELLKEELGDLLFQVLFHAKMASEKRQFDIVDVIDGVVRKLIHRHPHVFTPNKSVKTAEEVLTQWHKIKMTEKRYAHRRSIVDGIPKALPALQKAHKLQKKVAKVGFDWARVDEVLAKVEEELAEVRQALKENNRTHIAEEVGDLLFMVANLSRFVGLEPESVLHQTIRKISNRIRKMEEALHKKGKKMQDCTLAEMETLWEKAKALSFSRS